MKRYFKNRYVSIILLVYLFIVLSIFIINGKTYLFDYYIYQSIIIFYPRWTNFFKVITFVGSTIFVTSVSLCCLFLVKKYVNYFIVSCIVISTILNNLLKIIFKRERPIFLSLVKESSYSFPSGHTMTSASLYGIFIYLIWKTEIKKRYKIVLTCFLITLILLIGISRIYLGAHFATDVMGSLIISTILLIIFISYLKNNYKKIIKKTKITSNEDL